MKSTLIIIISVALIGTMRAELPDPILAAPMSQVSLHEVYLPDVLDFFRKRGAYELRRQTGDSTVVLKFDYDFDPFRDHSIINYERKDTIFGKAFREVLGQQGLIVVVTGFDRMRISDAEKRK